MARKQLGTAPSDTNDAATVAYVQANKGSGSGSGTNVYVQQTNPGMTTPGEWWQIDGSGNLVTLWVETAGGTSYLVSDTWTGSTNAAWPAQWTESTFGNPSAFGSSIQNNQGQIAPGTAAYSGVRKAIAGVSNGNINVAVSYTPAVQGESYSAIVINTDNTYSSGNSFFPQNGYILQIGTNAAATQGTVTLFKYVGDVSTTVIAQQTVTLTAGTQYRFRLQRSGTTLQWRMWTVGNSEPSTWNATATDSGTQPSASIFYLASGNGNGTAPNVQNNVLWDDLQGTAS